MSDGANLCVMVQQFPRLCHDAPCMAPQRLDECVHVCRERLEALPSAAVCSTGNHHRATCARLPPRQLGLCCTQVDRGGWWYVGRLVGGRRDARVLPWLLVAEVCGAWAVLGRTFLSVGGGGGAGGKVMVDMLRDGACAVWLSRDRKWSDASASTWLDGDCAR